MLSSGMWYDILGIFVICLDKYAYKYILWEKHLFQSENN